MITVPVLKRSAEVSRREDEVVLRYLDDEITLRGPAAALFDRMLPLLRDRKPVGEIAERLGEPPARVEKLAGELARTGVIADQATARPGATMTGLELHALHRRYTNHWLREVYRHPFWEKVTTGSASRAQVVGFALEKYHYIESAHEHMGVAAANASPEMMPHLARHFIEEYGHGDIYRRGLQSLFADEVILSSQPLPSTRALCNFLREAAAGSSFAYYAGNEVLQMTENTGVASAAREVDDFHGAMRKHYPFTNGLVDSFIAHTRADQKLGHADVFLEMCRSIPPLTLTEAREAMRTARSAVEHLVLFLDGIDTFYAAFPVAPRLASTLLSE